MLVLARLYAGEALIELDNVNEAVRMLDPNQDLGEVTCFEETEANKVQYITLIIVHSLKKRDRTIQCGLKGLKIRVKLEKLIYDPNRAHIET